MTSSYSKTSSSVRPHEKQTFSKLSTVRTVFENLRFLVPENAVYTEGKKGQKISYFSKLSGDVWKGWEPRHHDQKLDSNILIDVKHYSN